MMGNISIVCDMSLLKRFASYFGTRSLDAGSVGRRWPSQNLISNLNTDVLNKGRTIRQRASYYAHNNAHARAAVNALVSNIVGPGIVPNSQHPDPDTRKKLCALWLRWTDQADFDGCTDFYGLQALAVRQMVETGESFVHLLSPEGEGVPLRLRLIHPAQIPVEWPSNLVSNLVRGGIEHDPAGRKTAYYALPFRPDDPLQAITYSFTPVRLPVADVAHMFEALEPGQIRGLSWFAPVLLALRELDELQDASLVRAKLSNLVCAAIIDPAGDGGGLPGANNSGTLDVSMEPGTILPMPPGRSIEFFDPKESANYGPFIRSHLQAIAAGIGIPYEMLTGDLSQVNYSSIRAGLVEFRKRLEHWQHNIVVFKFCRPVWDRFITMAVLSGKIDAGQYSEDPDAFHKVEWLPPKQAWVDPLKDAQSEILAIGAGLMSRRQAVAARGGDIDALRLEIETERAADTAANLSFLIGAGRPGAGITEVPPADASGAANNV